MRSPRRPNRSRPHRRTATLVIVALLAAGCTATDDGTRVRDLDGAGEPLDEASS